MFWLWNCGVNTPKFNTLNQEGDLPSENGDWWHWPRFRDYLPHKFTDLFDFSNWVRKASCQSKRGHDYLSPALSSALISFLASLESLHLQTVHSFEVKKMKRLFPSSGSVFVSCDASDRREEPKSRCLIPVRSSGDKVPLKDRSFPSCHRRGRKLKAPWHIWGHRGTAVAVPLLALIFSLT